MTQAIRRSQRYLMARQTFRRIAGGVRTFLGDIARDGIPRTRDDWAAFIGLAVWFVIVGLVVANWWGGA